MAGPCNSIGREGDSVVSRGEAGEDSRAEVELSTSSSRAICVVEVRQEGFKFHSLGRSDVIMLPGRDENNWKVANRWVAQSVGDIGSDFFSLRLLNIHPQFGC